MAVRGYDCAGVDTFLATLRNDVAEVQELHAAAQKRIEELEAGGVTTADGAASTETEGTLRRTLLLAQRLADETEAEAKAEAESLVAAARSEAETLVSDAEADATAKREASQAELLNAQNEAAAIRETVNSEAEQTRSEARTAAESLLASAEETGSARVAEIETIAQDEVAVMREPVREEVTQLETVRSQLLVDIADLEAHLEAQRVRVRNAVEALRTGMSGSIDDLERVAEDDALMAPEPAPAHSGANAGDVAHAPPVEIGEAVAATAAESTPDVETLQAAADQVVAESTIDPMPAHAAEPSVEETPDAHVEVDASSDADLGFTEPETVPAVEEFAGPDTEPIPVVAPLEGAAAAPYDAAAEVEPDTVEIVDTVEVIDTVEHTAVDAVEVDVAQETIQAELHHDELDTGLPGADALDDMDSSAAAIVEGVPAVEQVDVSDESGAGAGTFAALGGAAVGAAAFAGVTGGSEDVVEVGAENAMASAADLEEAELVLLEDEQDPLFGTDLGADAQVDEATVDDEFLEPANVGSNNESFVGRFAEALDQLPIEPQS